MSPSLPEFHRNQLNSFYLKRHEDIVKHNFSYIEYHSEHPSTDVSHYLLYIERRPVSLVMSLTHTYSWELLRFPVTQKVTVTSNYEL